METGKNGAAAQSGSKWQQPAVIGAVNASQRSNLAAFDTTSPSGNGTLLEAHAELRVADPRQPD